MHHCCLGAYCSPAASPFRQSLYILHMSSNLRQSYHCIYVFESHALPSTTAPLLDHCAVSCTPRAPLVHLQSLSLDFPLPGRRHLILVHISCILNLVHYSISCTSYSYASRAPLMHQSFWCTSRAPPITVVGLSAPWLSAPHTHAHLMHYSISCTTQSHALLNLVHLIFMRLSCTTYTRAPLVHQSFLCTSREPPITVMGIPAPWPSHLILVHISCTTQSRSPRSPHILLNSILLTSPHHLYSCTSRAPIVLVHLSCTSNYCRGTSRSLAVGTSCSCTRTRAPTRAPTHAIIHARAPIIKPTRCPIQEGLGPSPWRARNIPLAIC